MMSALTNHLQSFTVQRVVWVPHHYEFERVMGIMRPFCERLEGRFLWATRLVIGYEREDDAKRIAEILPKRFERFGLTIHPEKSRLLSFGKPAVTCVPRLGPTS